jgi:peptidoglycan/LPS O-acetylase OafA/YrhL
MDILLYCNLVLLLVLYCRFEPGNKLKYPIASLIAIGGILALLVQFGALSISLKFFDGIYFLCAGIMVILLLRKTWGNLPAPPPKQD